MRRLGVGQSLAVRNLNHIGFALLTTLVLESFQIEQRRATPPPPPASLPRRRLHLILHHCRLVGHHLLQHSQDSGAYSVRNVDSSVVL